MLCWERRIEGYERNTQRKGEEVAKEIGHINTEYVFENLCM